MKDLLLNATIQKMIVGAFAIVLLALVAVAKHFWPDVDSMIVGVLVTVSLSLLTTVGVYHVSGANRSRGFASPRLLALIAVSAWALLALTGCSSFATSWYVGIESAAHENIARTGDAVAKTVKDALCDTPASVLQRDARLATGREAVCGPIPSAASAGIQPADVAEIVRASRGMPATPAAPSPR